MLVLGNQPAGIVVVLVVHDEVEVPAASDIRRWSGTLWAGSAPRNVRDRSGRMAPRTVSECVSGGFVVERQACQFRMH